MGINLDINKMAEEIGLAIKPLADKIGQGAEAIYKMAVKDAYIYGVESWVFSAVSLLVILILARMSYWFFTKYEKDQDSDWLVGTWIFGLISFGLVFVCLSWFDSAIHYQLNPEYMALKDFLNTLNPPHHN